LIVGLAATVRPLGDLASQGRYAAIRHTHIYDTNPSHFAVDRNAAGVGPMLHWRGESAIPHPGGVPQDRAGRGCGRAHLGSRPWGRGPTQRGTCGEGWVCRMGLAHPDEQPPLGNQTGRGGGCGCHIPPPNQHTHRGLGPRVAVSPDFHACIRFAKHCEWRKGGEPSHQIPPDGSAGFREERPATPWGSPKPPESSHPESRGRCGRRDGVNGQQPLGC